MTGKAKAQSGMDACKVSNWQVLACVWNAEITGLDMLAEEQEPVKDADGLL